MNRKRPTVADLRAMKGKRQLTMLRVMTLEEAEAAERAGIDIVSVPPELMLDPRFRDAAPSIFAMPGDELLRDRHGRRLRPLGIPPLQGRRRRGLLQRRLRDDEAAGRRRHPGDRPCRPDPVARHLDRRLPRRRQDRRERHADHGGGARSRGRRRLRRRDRGGAGRGRAGDLARAPRSSCCRWAPAPAATRSTSSPRTCSATNRGHMPRHSKVYRNFAAEYDRLQAERVAAFSNTSPTWRAAPIPRTGTSSTWTRPSSAASSTSSNSTA